MLSFAERALGLNGKELRRALPIFAYLFLTMASSVASKAARDALFLDRYRAIDLPYVDIAIAALVGIADERSTSASATTPTCATCRSAA